MGQDELRPRLQEIPDRCLKEPDAVSRCGRADGAEQGGRVQRGQVLTRG